MHRSLKFFLVVHLLLMPIFLPASERGCKAWNPFTGQYLFNGSTVSGPAQVTAMAICQFCGSKGKTQFSTVSFVDPITQSTIIVNETAPIHFKVTDVVFVGANAAYGKLIIENFEGIQGLGPVNIEASFIATGNVNGETDELTLTGFKVVDNPFAIPILQATAKRISR